MTWTFASTDLSTTLARVRLLIGDTDTTDQQLTDEEIAFFTGQYGGPFFAAAAACDALSGRYARQASKTVGPLTIQQTDKQKHYADLAQRLRYQGATAGTGLTPYAGGISVSDRATVEADTDRQKGSFAIGMDDYPGTPLGRPSASSS